MKRSVMAGGMGLLIVLIMVEGAFAGVSKPMPKMAQSFRPTAGQKASVKKWVEAQDSMAGCKKDVAVTLANKASQARAWFAVECSDGPSVGFWVVAATADKLALVGGTASGGDLGAVNEFRVYDAGFPLACVWFHRQSDERRYLSLWCYAPAAKYPVFTFETGNDESLPRFDFTIVGDKPVIVDHSTKPSVKHTWNGKTFGEEGDTGATPSIRAAATLAIAFVYNAQEVWLGNDDYEGENSPARHLGILKDLKLAIDRADFAHSVPLGALGVVVTYADSPVVRIPVGPINTVTGAALGTQKDYNRKFGANLVNGIELAMVELDKTAASKKVIIVFSDGNDTNNDAARNVLAKLKTDLVAHQITPYAMIYKGELSEPGNVVTVLVPNAVTIASAGDAPVTLARILHECCQP